MKKRALALFAIIATILAVGFHGAGQFGYVFFGFLAAIGSVLKVLIRFSGWPALSVLAPLLVILIMLAYVAIIIATISALIWIVLKKENPIRKFRIEVMGCFTLGTIMIVGLIFATVFPGDQDQPLVFPLSYFIYPIILLMISALLNKNYGAEPSA